MNLVIFLRNFDGILSEFHRISRVFSENDEISRVSHKKCPKNAEKGRKFRNLCQISFVHFIVSIVSLSANRRDVGRAAGTSRSCGKSTRRRSSCASPCSGCTSAADTFERFQLLARQESAALILDVLFHPFVLLCSFFFSHVFQVE